MSTFKKLQPFKDFYFSRIDMMMLIAELDGRCIAENQRITLYSLKDPRQGLVEFEHCFKAKRQYSDFGKIDVETLNRRSEKLCLDS